MLSNPQPLYDICINANVENRVRYRTAIEFRLLPNNVLFDFYYKMFLDKRLCLLAVELCDLDIFVRILSVKHQRTKLLRSFQALIDHRANVPEELIRAYTSIKPEIKKIDTGLKIGAFWNEGGWFNYSIQILNLTEEVCLKQEQNVNVLTKLLDCYHKRIYAEAIYCKFDEADVTFRKAQDVVRLLKESNKVPNLAGLYANFSMLFSIRSDYDEALMWSIRALELISEDLPSRIIVDVLRQASKSCVVKRRFSQAGLLIRQAVNLCSKLYAVDNHPHFSDALMDYGFYLLNFDSIKESVTVYEKALTIRQEVFEKNNIHIALAHEDMAYALYVNEYSSGRFFQAQKNAERSLRILERILPKNHLRFASIKRVKALILEEMALDMRDSDSEEKKNLLYEAQELHKAALDLSYKAFGEKNVQTAKHYGNLGRLYQTMKMYDDAVKMHLRAIAIKEELLGEEDYEVGLSIGHLASLYNYHMARYDDAEPLYKRSIEINLNLFGEAYSGLEYDYRGLINIYTKIMKPSQRLYYMNKMTEWHKLRSELAPVVHQNDVQPLKKLLTEFFEMCQQ